MFSKLVQRRKIYDSAHSHALYTTTAESHPRSVLFVSGIGRELNKNPLIIIISFSRVDPIRRLEFRPHEPTLNTLPPTYRRVANAVYLLTSFETVFTALPLIRLLHTAPPYSDNVQTVPWIPFLTILQNLSLFLYLPPEYLLISCSFLKVHIA